MLFCVALCWASPATGFSTDDSAITPATCSWTRSFAPPHVGRRGPSGTFFADSRHKHGSQRFGCLRASSQSLAIRGPCLGGAVSPQWPWSQLRWLGQVRRGRGHAQASPRSAGTAPMTRRPSPSPPLPAAASRRALPRPPRFGVSGIKGQGPPPPTNSRHTLDRRPRHARCLTGGSSGQKHGLRPAMAQVVTRRAPRGHLASLRAPLDPPPSCD